MTVFWIKGIPGSGKTYICRRLDVACHDTDDIVADVWRQLSKSKSYQRLVQTQPRRAERRFRVELKRATDALIAQANDADQDIVFAGITLPIEADETYFIQMSKRQLAKAYRRVVERELRKVLDHGAALLRIARTAPLDMVGLDLNHLHGVEAINITTLWPDYVRMYKGALAFEKRRGARVATQDQIARRIAKATQK
jgi:hypothetical protein